MIVDCIVASDRTLYNVKNWKTSGFGYMNCGRRGGNN